MTLPKNLDEVKEMFDDLVFTRGTVGFLEDEIVKVIKAEHMGDIQYKLMPEIKSFLDIVWNAGRESVIEDVKGMKRIRGEQPYMWLISEPTTFIHLEDEIHRVSGYNTALSDVITKLSELKK